MQKIRFFQVDAFSSSAFKGNPAAVCLLEEELPKETMQSIAEENNLSETAFVLKIDDGYSLRWFTPTVEVSLCGHATLASAHVLYQQGVLNLHEIANFYTKSGLLTAHKYEDWIELDFPAAFYKEISLPEKLKKALNAYPVNVVFARDRYIVELGSEEEVYACRPDFNVLGEFDIVIITAVGKESSSYDFISRTFAPSHGIDEDPVTGSSHCCLVPYWSEKLGKQEMFAFQASSRGGELKLKLAQERVLFSGQAVTVIEGFFLLNNIKA